MPRRSSGLLLIALLLAPRAPAQDPVAKVREGQTLMEKGRFDDALAKFKDAQIERPDSAEIHLDIGLAQFRLQKLDDAVTSFMAAAAAKDVKIEALARFHLGNALFRQGNLEEALANYTESIRLNPGDEDAKYNREIVIRHIKEKERNRKDEEKKQEIQKLIQELLAAETGLTRATRVAILATGEAVQAIAVPELAPDLDVAAESRPDERLEGPALADRAKELALMQTGILKKTAEVLAKVRTEAESKPASGPSAPAQDPEKLKRALVHLEKAQEAMKAAEADLGKPALADGHGSEQKALRALLDALYEFLDELTRIIRDQGENLRATEVCAKDGGIPLKLPAGAESRAAAAESQPETAPATRPVTLSPDDLGRRAAALGATEKALGGRTDAFSTGVEQRLQQMKAAESKPAASKPSDEKRPNRKDVEEALTHLHAASSAMSVAARQLEVPRLQEGFDAELLALRELILAKQKLSPPGGGNQNDQKKDQDKKDEQKDKDKDKEKKDDKKLSPEEAAELLRRSQQQEKDERQKKKDKAAPPEAKVKKDW